MKRYAVQFPVDVEEFREEIDSILSDEFGIEYPENATQGEKPNELHLSVPLATVPNFEEKRDIPLQGKSISWNILPHITVVYNESIDMGYLGQAMEEYCIDVCPLNRVTAELYGTQGALDSAVKQNDLMVGGVSYKVSSREEQPPAPTSTPSPAEDFIKLQILIQPTSKDTPTPLRPTKEEDIAIWAEDIRKKLANYPEYIQGAVLGVDCREYFFVRVSNERDAGSLLKKRFKLTLTGTRRQGAAPDFSFVVVSGNIDRPQSRSSASSVAPTPSAASPSPSPAPGPSVPYGVAFSQPAPLKITVPVPTGHVRVVFEDSYKDVSTKSVKELYEILAEQLGPSRVIASDEKRKVTLEEKHSLQERATYYATAPLSYPIILPAQFTLKGDTAETPFASLEKLFKCLGYGSVPVDGGKTFLYRDAKCGGGSLLVMEKAVEWLSKETGNKKISFLSVVGPPRNGKSTFMNLLQRLFGNNSFLFTTSDDTVSAHTVGIWATPVQGVRCWDKDYKRVDPNSVVIYLDSEGLFAEDGKGEAYHVRMFTIMSILSSCLIFNKKTSNLADQDFRRTLSGLSAKYALLVENVGRWILDYSPQITYLARDWNTYQSLDEDRETYNESKKQFVDDDSLNHFWKMFPNFGFSSLPAPVGDINKHDVVNRSIDKDFAKKLSEIWDREIQRNLKPLVFKTEDSEVVIQNISSLKSLLYHVITSINNSSKGIDFNTALIKVIQTERENIVQVQLAQLKEELSKLDINNPKTKSEIHPIYSRFFDAVCVLTKLDEDSIALFKQEGEKICEEVLQSIREILKAKISKEFTEEIQSRKFNDLNLEVQRMRLGELEKQKQLTAEDVEEVLHQMNEQLNYIKCIPLLAYWREIVHLLELNIQIDQFTSETQELIEIEYLRRIPGIEMKLRLDETSLDEIVSRIYNIILDDSYAIIQLTRMMIRNDLNNIIQNLFDIGIAKQIDALKPQLFILFEPFKFTSDDLDGIAQNIVADNMDKAKEELKGLLTRYRIPTEKFKEMEKILSKAHNLLPKVQEIGKYSVTLIQTHLLDDYQVSFSAPCISTVLTQVCNIPESSFSIQNNNGEPIIILRDSEVFEKLMEFSSSGRIIPLKDMKYRIPRGRYIVPADVKFNEYFTLSTNRQFKELDSSSEFLYAELQHFDRNQPHIVREGVEFVMHKRWWFLAYPCKDEMINELVTLLYPQHNYNRLISKRAFKGNMYYLTLDIPWSCSSVPNLIKSDNLACLVEPLKENTWVTPDIVNNVMEKWQSYLIETTEKIDRQKILANIDSWKIEEIQRRISASLGPINIGEELMKHLTSKLKGEYIRNVDNKNVWTCWNIIHHIIVAEKTTEFPEPVLPQGENTPPPEEALNPLIDAWEKLVAQMDETILETQHQKLNDQNVTYKELPKNLQEYLYMVVRNVKTLVGERITVLRSQRWDKELKNRIGFSSSSSKPLDTSSVKNLAKYLFENNLHRYIFIDKDEQVPQLWRDLNSYLETAIEWKQSKENTTRTSYIARKKHTAINHILGNPPYDTNNGFEYYIPAIFKVIKRDERGKMKKSIFRLLNSLKRKVIHIEQLENDEFVLAITLSIPQNEIETFTLQQKFTMIPIIKAQKQIYQKDTPPTIVCVPSTTKGTTYLCPTSSDHKWNNVNITGASFQYIIRSSDVCTVPHPSLLPQVPVTTDDYEECDMVCVGEWDVATYINLMTQYGSDRDLSQNLRVLSMLHTRRSCRNRSYPYNNRMVPLNDISKIRNTLYSSTPKPKEKWFHYNDTRVEVVDKDTVAAILEYRKQYSNVMAINMANRRHPGGGFKKGSRAQEEDLFRRTTLSCALTEGYDVKDVPKYPLEEFSYVISTNIESFRDSEDRGFSYLESPVSCNIITAAAYNAGTSSQREEFVVVSDQNNKFTEEGWNRTARNIYNILCCAAEFGAEVLILSALGCGAFKNPPNEVAEMFKELIQLFGGCFRVIVFAIMDANDPMQKIQSNYTLFRKWIPNQNIAENKVLLKHIPFKNSIPLATCDFHSQCKYINNRTHKLLYSHTDNCPLEPTCPYRWKCKDDNDNHMKSYRHPLNECEQRENCKDKNASHLKELSHPPECPRGFTCKEIHTPGVYRHLKKMCHYGTFCRRFRDKEHLHNFNHPFVDACETILGCTKTDKQHTEHVSHLCPWGNNCTSLNDPGHLRLNIHIKLPLCPRLPNCNASEFENYDDHLAMFSHPGIRSCRHACKDNNCIMKSNPQHLQKVRHSPNEVPLNTVYGHNIFKGLYENGERRHNVSFYKNAATLIKSINDHFKQEFNQAELKATIELFKKFRPVHRCSVKTFGLLLHSGFLSSLHYLQTIQALGSVKDPEILLTLPAAAQALKKEPTIYHDILEFVRVLNDIYQVDRAPKKEKEGGLDLIDNKKDSDKEKIGGQQAYKLEREKRKKEISSRLARILTNGEIERITQESLNHIQAIEQLAVLDELGIGYEMDRMFETNKMVFSILGPHTYNYGIDKDHPDCDGVHIVMSKRLLFHPDVYCTPCAATFYNSHSTHCDNKTVRPWGLSAKIDGKHYDRMWNEKLHPSSSNFYEALALEFMARVAHNDKIDPSKVTRQTVIDYWFKTNAHLVVECHLPYMTSLPWIEKVIVNDKSFGRLDSKLQDEAKAIFQKGLSVVKEKSDDAQFKYVMTSAPSVRPSFNFTLPERTSCLLPLSTKKRSCYIFFRSNPNSFGVSLLDDKEKEVGNLLVHGMNASFNDMVINSWAIDDSFNRDVAYNDLGLLYCLHYNNNQITLSKRGGSDLYGDNTLKSSCNPFSYIKFMAGHGAATCMLDVRVLFDEEKMEENEKAVVSPPVQKDSLVSSNPVQNELPTQPNLFQKAWNFVAGLFKEPELPPCPQGASCRLHYHTKSGDPAKLDHQNKFSHMCLYGKSCDLIREPTHFKSCFHLEKPDCQRQPCTQLTDVQHRAEFHHPKLWDILLPCKDGARCRSQDPDHRNKYHHTNTEYTFTNGKLQLHFDEEITQKPNSQYKKKEKEKEKEEKPYQQQNPYVEEKISFTFNPMTQTGGNDSFYNETAINGDYSKAQFDQYGNPVGGDYDLAKDGAFKGFTVMIGCFYVGEGGPESIKTLTIPVLKQKGFEVIYVESEADFLSKLNTNIHCAWIISSNTVNGSKETFREKVLEYHKQGGGLFLFGDNAPYFEHVNLLTPTIADCLLVGNTPGEKTLKLGDPKSPGFFGKHLITTGVKELYEGITICYPSKISVGIEVVGTSSNNQPVLVVKDSKGKNGRVVIDNGFTKLYKQFWNTAGTPRYISNCCAWLINVEKKKKPFFL